MSTTTWVGGVVEERIECVVAPNAGPLTLDGTNTWVFHPTGSDEALVVDPGPEDETHVRAVFDVVQQRGARVRAALLTHGHEDHCDGAWSLSDLAGCPIVANNPAHADDTVTEGDVVEVGDLTLSVLVTPGHTSDSVAFLLAEDGIMFGGDTVLGRGTSFVAHPDGALGPYLSSLRRLRDLAADGTVRLLLPGHGPPITEPLEVIEHYLEHRAERLEQVRAAVAGGARTPGEVVARVYADVDRALWPAAERSVRAQMDYLASEVSGRDA